jgi:hypothetical protein
MSVLYDTIRHQDPAQIPFMADWMYEGSTRLQIQLEIQRYHRLAHAPLSFLVKCIIRYL